MCFQCRHCIGNCESGKQSVLKGVCAAALLLGLPSAGPAGQSPVPQGTAESAPPASPVEGGAAALRAGQPQQALALLQQAIAANPQDSSANLLAASAELALYDGPAAVRYAERAQVLEPGNWKIHTTLVTAYSMAGDVAHRDAERLYLRKAHEDGTLPDAKETTGFLLDQFRAGRYRVDAVEYFHPLGRYNTYYRFLVRNTAGVRVWVVEVNSDSLNQASWAQAYPRQAKEGQRQFQIESAQGPLHKEYRTFSGAPSYDYMRAQVVKIVEAQTAPVAGEAAGK